MRRHLAASRLEDDDRCTRRRGGRPTRARASSAECVGDLEVPQPFHSVGLILGAAVKRPARPTGLGTLESDIPPLPPYQ